MERVAISKGNSSFVPHQYNQPEDSRTTTIDDRSEHEHSLKGLHLAEGCYVWDEEGNNYVDLIMGSGSALLGHNNKDVRKAVRKQTKKGASFSRSLEADVVKLISEMVPGSESVQFCRTDRNALDLAVELARLYTGRPCVLRCKTDSHFVEDSARNGPPNHFDFQYNNLTSLDQAMDKTTACVVLEPVTFDEPDPEFLSGASKLCKTKGALLIFDETWTGFRISNGGAQEYFNVIADLVCFSRSMANGMPLSVISGRADVLRMADKAGSYFPDFGEILSLVAAKGALPIIRSQDVPAHIAYGNQLLRNCYNKIAQELNMPYTKCVGLDYRTRIIFDPVSANPMAMHSFMQDDLFRHGILWNGYHNLSLAHEHPDLVRVLSAYAQALPALKGFLGNQ